MVRARAGRGWVIAISVAAATMAATAVAGCIATGLSWRQVVGYYELTNIALGASFVACGALIAWFVPRNAVGWLFMISGVGHLGTASLSPVALLAAHAGAPETFVDWIATIGSQAWGLGVAGLFGIALLLFPDGRLPGRGWWAAAVLIVLATIGQAVTGMLAPGPLLPGQDARSVIALPEPLPGPLLDALGLASTAGTVAAIASLVVRYVRGDERVRRQLLWLIFALLLIIGLNLQRFWTGDGPIPLLLTFVLVPVAITIAIVRHGLLDIRLVLSRTILYGLLVAVVVATYAGIVAGLSALLPASTDRAVAAGAALVVAIAFDPLRRLLQRTVGRALFGARSDPARAAARLEQDLAEGGRDLTGVLDRLRTELRFPGLAVEDAAGGVLAMSGDVEQAAAPPTALPLAFDGATQGRLLVSLRPGERSLHDSDRHVLALLAAPLAVMLHALALTAEVSAARIHVVEEREQERARLQRELHDGLGPVLTSAAYRLDAASNLADHPERAQPLLTEARGDLRAAIASVREVVHGLRPIELEESGLRAALRERLRSFTETDRPAVELRIPDRLPDLSPAVELAAYRIVLEAVTNAIRHSRAQHCTVAVSPTPDALELLIDDDGQPDDGWVAGTGLRSMRHRAEEVGGTFSAGPDGSGWSVSALLPVA